MAENSQAEDNQRAEEEGRLTAEKNQRSAQRTAEDNQSDTSSTGSSNQTKKSSSYRDNRYIALPEVNGSYMNSSDLVPKDSLFRDDIFEKICRTAQEWNETMVFRDITPLIVPSAESLAMYGATHLDHLIESVNEGWTEAIPVGGPPPQPDYSVGFRSSAFTDEQLQRLNPLLGSIWDMSFFVATHRMYFPFLTCEVKCAASSLEIADRQNAHSMILAVRAIVELFRMVKREEELHREILAFSISHDHRAVRIYGHYPVIDGKKTTFYRHHIHEFSFTALDGKDKWTAYRFTKNVYDVWMPAHLKRICSIINQLPSDLGDLLSEPSNVGSG